MQAMVLKIKGMSCQGCVKSVTNVLQALPGVGAVEVSLERAEAHVEYDAARVGREQMSRAVADAGFEAA